MSLSFSNKRMISLLLFMSLNTHYHVFAQHTSATSESIFFDQVRVGGSLGIHFSNHVFSAFLAPKAIYDFNTITSAGIGIAGSYTNGDTFSAHSFSGSVIGLFRPIRNIQISTEFEEYYISRDWELEGINRKDSYWYPALFLGLGYDTGPVTAGIRYDLLYDEQKSIYSSALMPFISVYF